uniref:Uncharacterized protein n=1 Tax=Knipowitschia caucasica TaxID=637954 RepID=A0AAV2KRE3_KNICA
MCTPHGEGNKCVSEQKENDCNKCVEMKCGPPCQSGWIRKISGLQQDQGVRNSQGIEPSFWAFDKTILQWLSN